MTSLRGIEELQQLREINAQNNKIAQLHAELQDLYTLESLNLIGNPIVNQHPKLARIENDEAAVQDALNTYFSSLGGFGGAGSASITSLN